MAHPAPSLDDARRVTHEVFQHQELHVCQADAIVRVERRSDAATRPTGSSPRSGDVDGDSLVVLFDEVGYRTPDAGIAARRGLLETG